MKKIYKAVEIGLLGFAVLLNVYHAIPIEIQQNIPFLNQGVVIATSLFAGTTSGVMLYFDSFITKLKQTQETKDVKSLEGILSLLKEVDRLSNLVKEDKKERTNINILSNNLNLQLEQLINMFKVDLSIKRDDVLINEHAKELIDNILGKGEEHEENEQEKNTL